MKIHCISCGHQVELDDETYSRYKGPVRCWVCQAMLNVRIVDGCVESVSFPGMAAPSRETEPAPPAASRAFPTPRVTKPQPVPRDEGVAS